MPVRMVARLVNDDMQYGPGNKSLEPRYRSALHEFEQTVARGVTDRGARGHQHQRTEGDPAAGGGCEQIPDGQPDRKTVQDDRQCNVILAAVTTVTMQTGRRLGQGKRDSVQGGMHTKAGNADQQDQHVHLAREAVKQLLQCNRKNQPDGGEDPCTGTAGRNSRRQDIEQKQPGDRDERESFEKCERMRSGARSLEQQRADKQRDDGGDEQHDSASGRAAAHLPRAARPAGLPPRMSQEIKKGLPADGHGMLRHGKCAHKYVTYSNTRPTPDAGHAGRYNIFFAAGAARRAGMMDPAWQGDVAFYELVFGTWLSYGFLVLVWERVLRAPAAEWKYVMITFLGASFFWVNHYFQRAPFYLWLLNGYSLVFLAAWFRLLIRGRHRSPAWKAGGLLFAVIYTVAFILFEQLARAGVDRLGMNEFWFMLIAYFGFVGLILWRGRRPAN